MDVVWASHRDAWGPRSGGAELSAFELSRGLASRGHRVRIFSVAHDHEEWHAGDGAVEVRRVPTDFVAHLTWPPYRWSARPDVVVEDVAHVVPFGGRLVSRTPGVVAFRHLHRRTLRRQVGAISAALLTRVERAYPSVYAGWTFVTESASSGEDLRRLGVPADDIQVIPPGIDIALFRRRSRAQRPTLVYFGGLRAYKRPEHAVRVLGGLREMGDDAVLEVIGDGPWLPVVQGETRRRALEPFVEFTGRLSRSEVAERVARAWLNVHCSVSEGWCFSALEAAAAGVPTVAYRIPGLTDSVAEGRSGRLVPDGDLDALTLAAHHILGQIDAWSRSAEQHGQSFAWEPAVVAWERVLLATARRGARTGRG